MNLLAQRAVVLNLGYLAVQIRQGSKSSRQQSYYDLVTRRTNLLNKMVESDYVTAIVIIGMRGDAMKEIEAQRFTSWSLNYVSHMQDVYLQWRAGLVEENVWLAERQFLAVLVELPGFAAWWQVATQYYLPEFISEVAKLEPIPVVVMDQETGKWVLGTW